MVCHLAKRPEVARLVPRRVLVEAWNELGWLVSHYAELAGAGVEWAKTCRDRASKIREELANRML